MPFASADHDLRVAPPWSLSEPATLLVAIAMVPAFAVLDFAAGRGASLHLLYLLPVGFAAWNLGARAGYAIAAVTGLFHALVVMAAREPGDGAAAFAWDAGVPLALFAFVVFLVARHRDFVDGLRATARVDADSGALSRREFDRLLDAEVRRSMRYRRPMALVLCELGETRAFGPRRLSAVVNSVRSIVRDCDSVARVSNKRFAVLLVECKAPEPMLVVERLRENLVGNLHLREIDLTLSVATYSGGMPATAASLLSLAENHIYFAKSNDGVAETRVD